MESVNLKQHANTSQILTERNKQLKLAITNGRSDHFDIPEQTTAGILGMKLKKSVDRKMIGRRLRSNNTLSPADQRPTNLISLTVRNSGNDRPQVIQWKSNSNFNSHNSSKNSPLRIYKMKLQKDRKEVKMPTIRLNPLIIDRCESTHFKPKLKNFIPLKPRNLEISEAQILECPINRTMEISKLKMTPTASSKWTQDGLINIQQNNLRRMR